MTVEEILRALNQWGALGLVAWLFYQTHKVTLPGLTESFNKALDRLQETFKAGLKEVETGFVEKANAMFLAEIRQQRTDFRDELSKQRHALLNVLNGVNLEKHDLTQRLEEAHAALEKAGGEQEGDE